MPIRERIQTAQNHNSQKTIPMFKNPMTLDVNQDRLNASITIEDKDPYTFGTLDKAFRIKSAVQGRRGIKSSGSVRSINRTRNTLNSKSTIDMNKLTSEYKGMTIKQISELYKHPHTTDGWSVQGYKVPTENRCNKS